MAQKPPSNAFVEFARRVYNPVGFTKGYNFVLFFIFAGAFFGFTLARLHFLDIDKSFCMSGQALDCYYYTPGSVDRIGFLIHLAAILPAALLTCLQFVPVIRHKVILFHRINGYLILILSLVSTAGAIMLARNALGGWMEVQTGVGFLSIAFLVSLGLAVYNVKRLQIEQHRAWMLRAWFYVSVLSNARIVSNSRPRLAQSSQCGSSSLPQPRSSALTAITSLCPAPRFNISFSALPTLLYNNTRNAPHTFPTKTLIRLLLYPQLYRPTGVTR